MAKTFKLENSLSVVIPAYNEEGNLRHLVKETLKDAAKVTDDFEIIVVNDGSSDKTAKVADSLAKTYKNVIAIHHKKNQGLAGAFRTGIKVCRKDIILYIEGDGQQPLKDQYQVLKKIRRYDVVLGTRSERFDYSFFRKCLSHGFLFFLWLFFNLTYKDVGWSQAYRRKIFDKIELKSSSPFFCAELVIKALRSGFTVSEAPVVYRSRKRGSTSYGNILTAYTMLREMILLRVGLLE
jgi:glycosyltransferase involved in cell wall biosynthesis